MKKRSFLFIIWLLSSYLPMGQVPGQFKIRILENWEQGAPLGGVTINAKDASVAATYSGDGFYLVKFTDSKVGNTINLTLTKPGYKVVNWRHLQTAIPAFSINEAYIMCIENELAKRAEQYYSIKIENALEKKIAESLKQLAQVLNNNKEQREIIDRLAMLQTLLANRDMTNNIVSNLANTKQEAEDTTYISAFNALLNGNFETASLILSEQALDAEAIIIENKEVQIKLDKEKLSNKYGLRGDLDFLNIDIQSAIANYQKSNRLNPRNFQTIQKLISINASLASESGMMEWIKKGLEIDTKNDDDLFNKFILTYQYNVSLAPDSILKYAIQLNDSAAGLDISRNQSLILLHSTLGFGYLYGGKEKEGLKKLDMVYKLDSNKKIDYFPYIIQYYLNKNSCADADKYFNLFLSALQKKTKGNYLKDLYNTIYIKYLYIYSTFRQNCFNDNRIIKKTFDKITDLVISNSSTSNTNVFVTICADYLDRYYEDQERDYRDFLKKLVTRFESSPSNSAHFSIAKSYINYQLCNYYDDNDDSINARNYYYKALSDLYDNISQLNDLLFATEILIDNPFELKNNDPIVLLVRKMVTKVNEEPEVKDRDLVKTILYTSINEGDIFSEGEMDSLIAGTITSARNEIEKEYPMLESLDAWEDAPDMLIDYYLRKNMRQGAMDLAVSQLRKKQKRNPSIYKANIFHSLDYEIGKIMSVYIRYGDFNGAVNFIDETAKSYVANINKDTVNSSIAIIIAYNEFLFIYKKYKSVDNEFANKLINKMEYLYSLCNKTSVADIEQRLDMESFRKEIQKIEDAKSKK